MTRSTELDRLDPAPRLPRAPRRRKGPAETAVCRDLGKLPTDLRMSSVAVAAVLLARQLDEGGMTPRDASGHVRELRMCMTQLREWNPSGTQAGDATDTARAQVEKARALYVVDIEARP